MERQVAIDLRNLLKAARAELGEREPTLRVDERFSFDVMEPQGLRLFFHWPPEIEAAVCSAAEGAVLVTLMRGTEAVDGPRTLSRAAVLYKDVKGAEDASATLASWLVETLMGDAKTLEIADSTRPDVGETVLWSLSGRMRNSADEVLHRADVGWRRGAAVACAVAFGADEVFDLCREGAQQFDASIAGSIA